MALTPSNMLELGTIAPDFNLPNVVSGSTTTLKECIGDKGILVMFICNHCPFVIHVEDRLVSLAKEYEAKGVGVVAISSNDVNNYPQDRPELMAERAQEKNFSFPYLYDESQSVAKEYQAACTPDFYLFNNKLELVYRGQLDDSRPGNDIPVTGADLRKAMDQLLAGEPVFSDQKPSVGCNIKWR